MDICNVPTIIHTYTVSGPYSIWTTYDPPCVKIVILGGGLAVECLQLNSFFCEHNSLGNSPNKYPNGRAVLKYNYA